MQDKMLVIACALTLVMLAGAGCQKEAREEPQALVESEIWAPPDSLIFEQVWLYFDDKPEEYFFKAGNDLEAGDLEAASHDLRTAAAYLKVEAARGRGASKKALKASIQELEDTAGRIKDGAVIPDGEMDRMFARAHLALAEHHYDRVSDLLKLKEKGWIRAGEELDVSAIHIQHGMGWITGSPDQARHAALGKIRETAGELTEGKLIKAETINKAVEKLASEIAIFRTDLGLAKKD
jgi:hypothetical protein